jgi:hypothetical protein
VSPDEASESSSELEMLKECFKFEKTYIRTAEVVRFWNSHENTNFIREIRRESFIEDFESMINNPHHDLVLPAMLQIMSVISDLISLPENMSLAVDAMKHLRSAAVREDEFDRWNEFLRDLKNSMNSPESYAFLSFLAKDDVTPTTLEDTNKMETASLSKSMAFRYVGMNPKNSSWFKGALIKASEPEKSFGYVGIAISSDKNFKKK